MAITVDERFRGRSGSSTSRRLEYLVKGTDDDALVLSNLNASVAATHNGLVLTNITIKQQGDETWYGTAVYGALNAGSNIPEPESGTASYTFNAHVEPDVELYSQQQIARFPASAPKNLYGPIGISTAAGGRHEGIQIPAGPVTDTITYEYPAAVIPGQYRSAVRASIGGVNNTTFLNNPAGTMRLVSVTASITSEEKQSITFSWAYRARRQVKVGDFDLGLVDGWDFFWSYDEQVAVDFKGETSVFARPKYVYHERLIPRINFLSLGLPVA